VRFRAGIEVPLLKILPSKEENFQQYHSCKARESVPGIYDFMRLSVFFS
jgi:hypothetical protein